jgi:hypothetical protein
MMSHREMDSTRQGLEARHYGVSFYTKVLCFVFLMLVLLFLLTHGAGSEVLSAAVVVA